ncbi:MAG: hypothetical protein GF384_07495, partial [Elusimicrobia bacterium]|nr:hypothetical protein [Elusimicrobiota bacterium]MBD3412494.1 hypothetical protein [Elusimicrobiota bacterium]
MMKIKTLMLIMVAVITFQARLTWADSEELPDLENKVALELGLEKRLKAILTEVLGTDKISITVTVDLYTKKERITINREQPASKQSAGMILPGVPVQEKIGEQGALLAPLTYEENRTMIKRLTANILLDSQVSDELLAMVERVSKTLLGINPARGDKLVIERIPFGTWYIDWKEMLQPPDIYLVIALIIALISMLIIAAFIFGPFRAFFTHLVESIQSIAESGPGSVSATAGAGGMSASDISRQMGGASDRKRSTDKPRPFDFIHDTYLNDLVFLCRKETPESVAILVSYLSPQLASKLINALDKSTQEQVISELAQIKEKPPEVIKGLERMIKEKIDYLIGGEDRLQQIVN